MADETADGYFLVVRGRCRNMSAGCTILHIAIADADEGADIPRGTCRYILRRAVRDRYADERIRIADLTDDTADALVSGRDRDVFDMQAGKAAGSADLSGDAAGVVAARDRRMKDLYVLKVGGNILRLLLGSEVGSEITRHDTGLAVLCIDNGIFEGHVLDGAVQDAEEARIGARFALEVGNLVTLAVEVDCHIIRGSEVKRHPADDVGHVYIIFHLEPDGLAFFQRIGHLLEVVGRLEKIGGRFRSFALEVGFLFPGRGIADGNVCQDAAAHLDLLLERQGIRGVGFIEADLNARFGRDDHFFFRNGQVGLQRLPVLRIEAL